MDFFQQTKICVQRYANRLKSTRLPLISVFKLAIYRIYLFLFYIRMYTGLLICIRNIVTRNMYYLITGKLSIQVYVN